MATAPAMNLKIFLPMGEKPPDTFGRGGDASSTQASLVITFLCFCQALQEFLVLPSAILHSTVCPLIAIILYDTRLPPPAVGHEIALVFFMQLHQLTTNTAAATITTPTVITDNNNKNATANNNKTAHLLIVTILYNSSLPQPPAVTFGFGSALAFLIQHLTKSNNIIILPFQLRLLAHSY
jgi:hypothetical protein